MHHSKSSGKLGTWAFEAFEPLGLQWSFLNQSISRDRLKPPELIPGSFPHLEICKTTSGIDFDIGHLAGSQISFP
jgi:hypothetical protein